MTRGTVSGNRCAACGGILSESSQVCVSCYAKARDKGFEEGTRLAETAACCAADDAAKAYKELEEKHLNECRQISGYEAENKELKELLRKAVHDFRRVTKGCLGIQCDSCPHIATFNGCIWQYAEEALKLIGGER